MCRKCSQIFVKCSTVISAVKRKDRRKGKTKRINRVDGRWYLGIIIFVAGVRNSVYEWADEQSQSQI